MYIPTVNSLMQYVGINTKLSIYKSFFLNIKLLCVSALTLHYNLWYQAHIIRVLVRSGKLYSSASAHDRYTVITLTTLEGIQNIYYLYIHCQSFTKLLILSRFQPILRIFFVCWCAMTNSNKGEIGRPFIKKYFNRKSC